jgi:hypothetical protein
LKLRKANGLPELMNSTVSADIIRSAVLQAWVCAFADSRVIYLSGPLNTGPRLIERVRRGDAGPGADTFKTRHAEGRKPSA